jgi:CRP/FNR family transcriptional regulator, cyclic AMP receptor protein
MATIQSQAREFLKSSSFLGGLPDQVLEKIANRAHLVKFAKGQTIFTCGDSGDNLMIVVSGRIKIFNIAADAREIIVNFLGKGDLLGEIAMLDGLARTASAMALEPVETIVIYRRDLLPVLQSNAEAMMEVVQALCQKLRATSAIVEENTLPMAACMSAGLLRLAEQHGRTTKGGILIDLKLSQRDLGGYLGLSRENTNRQLAVLRDAGYVNVDQSLITVVDSEALRAIAESASD